MSAALVALVLAAAGVRVEPATLTFGPEPARIDIVAPGAKAVQVRTADGAGAVSSAVAAGPGRFRATYTFPLERFPRVALLAIDVQSEAGARSLHWVALPLLANASLKIETKPLAEVTVTIGNSKFGPATADAKGKVTIAAQVAPGHPSATVVAVDRAGNSTTSSLDLGAQPFVRAAASLTSADASPDAAIPLEVFAVAADGTPLDSAATLRVSAQLGTCGAPTLRAGGVFTVAYHAPRALGAGHDTLTLAVADAPTTTLDIPLHPGAPAQIAVRTSPDRYVAGSGTPLLVVATLIDEQGNAASSTVPELSADFGRLELSAEGMRLVVPDAFAGRTAIHLRATAGTVSGEATVALLAGPPQRAVLALPGNVAPGASVEGTLTVSDAHGNPAEVGEVGVSASSGRAASVTTSPDGKHHVVYQAQNDDPPGPVDLEVRVGDLSLARRQVEVLPAQRAWAFVAGAFFTGSWNFLQARAVSPRLALGVRLGRSPFELGAEGSFGYYPRLEGAHTLDGLNDASIELTAWSFAAALRYQVRLAVLWSLQFSAALGAQHTQSTFTTPGAEPLVDAFWSPSLRASAGVGLHVLVGRLLLQVEVGWAPAPGDGRVRGNLSGLGLALGYLASF